MDLKNIHQDSIGFKVHRDFEILRINIVDENIIQVIASRIDNVQNIRSLSVIYNPMPTNCWKLEYGNNEIVLKTSNIQMVLSLPDYQISFKTKENNILLRENDSASRIINETKVMNEKTFEIKQSFKFKEGEALYGLGQHQDTDLKINYRSQEVDLYQDNVRIAVPVLISSEGYGILWDNYSLSKFKDSDEGSYFWSEIADNINYYFIYGPEIDDIIKEIRKLTGKCPMMPKYAFGFVQSKERYKDQQEIIGIVEEYRKRNIPIDLIVQDWRYWGSLLSWGQKSFISRRYPEPKKMCDDIHSMHAKIMISIWPNMSIITKDYREMKKAGFLYKNHFVRIYDSFNPDARNLYWKQTNEGLFKYGIDAWWCDSTEPIEFVYIIGKPNKQKIKKAQVKVLKRGMQPCIGTAARYLNAYSLGQSQNIYEHQRNCSDKRVLNLTRSGFTGQHRYSTFVWSGDISSRWDVLAAQIPACLNYCITGSPYWTVDIGGFFPGSIPILFNAKGDFPKGIHDLGFQELYTRWFQFGSFLPMFRSHGTGTPREVWRFGEPGSIFYDVLVKFINLRYRLLPYIYSLAWKITNEDYTMVRSLVFDFRHDPNVYNISDQYMFGAYIMVCPVLKPMYYIKNSKPINNEPKSRGVYLPKDASWFDFWTGKRYEGGQTIIAEAPLDIIPLFIKAGAILPLGPKKQYSGEPEDPIELRIYPDSDGSFIIYEDENDTYNYEQNQYSVIPLRWENKEKVLTIGKRSGSFKGMMEKRTFNITIISENKSNGLEPNQFFDKSVEYNGSEIKIRFN